MGEQRKMNSPKVPKKPKKKFDNFIRYSSLGFEMFAIMAIGVFLGYKLDGWLGLTFPVFTLVLATISVFAAIYHAIKDFL